MLTGPESGFMDAQEPWLHGNEEPEVEVEGDWMDAADLVSMSASICHFVGGVGVGMSKGRGLGLQLDAVPECADGDEHPSSVRPTLYPRTGAVLRFLIVTPCTVKRRNRFRS